MYQLPMLIRTRTISVPRATQSPWSQRAPRPYGLSTVSLTTGAAVIGAGAGAAADAVASAAGVEAMVAGAVAGAEAPCAFADHGDSASAQNMSAASVVAMRAGIGWTCVMTFFLSEDCEGADRTRGCTIARRSFQLVDEWDLDDDVAPLADALELAFDDADAVAG